MMPTSSSLPLFLNLIAGSMVSGSIAPPGLFKAKVVDSSKPKLSARIIGGSTAPEYPSYGFTAGDGDLCGGTLIHPDILLTAAHCEGAFLDGVEIGGTRVDGSESTFHSTAQEFPHPEYDSNGFTNNDIMLVKLAIPSPAPVTEVNYDANFPPDGTEVTVIGYGDTTDGGSGSFFLLEAQLNTESFVNCNGYYGTIVDDLQICSVGDGVTDTCQGDSGGPMLAPDGKVLGIVSFGDGCAKAGAPGVFARTSGYKDWIQDGICLLSSTPPNTCPTQSPTTTPTVSPASNPTGTPTGRPTTVPTGNPTHAPTTSPTAIPVTSAPTANPTGMPITSSPTANPTGMPIIDTPTANPTGMPVTGTPTANPIVMPITSAPTENPTGMPITNAPTENPTGMSITGAPATNPTGMPITGAPTANPTGMATTGAPIANPTGMPITSVPTVDPTDQPTRTPLNQPTTSAPVQALTTAAPVRAPSSTPSEFFVFDQTPSPTSAVTPSPRGKGSSGKVGGGESGKGGNGKGGSGKGINGKGDRRLKKMKARSYGPW